MTDVIFVVPPQGAPPQTGLVLADAVAAELRDKGRPAILSFEPNQAGASIVGKVKSTEPRGAVVWVRLDWSVRAPYGTIVASHPQQFVIDQALWLTGAPEAINLVIADAAPTVIGLVEMHVRPPSELVMIPSSARNRTEPEASPPPLQQTAPATQGYEPPPAPVSKPLARISDQTNGHVVMAPGMDTPPQPADHEKVPVTVSAQGEADPIPPPSELPSLLSLPETVSDAPPKPLVPGAGREVSPPPGGIGSPPPEKSVDEPGLLASLGPNMDTSERRADDARPAGPGGASFARVRWGQPSFLIRPVAGAPGNGNQALTAGLKSALRARDVTISEDPRQAGFIIDGEVDMGDPVNGRQYVRISWKVKTVAGDEVGKAVQENTVVAGSLDGEWGRVAESVAQAAVRGIQDLFGDADDTLRAREQLPAFPDVALPAIPGRAPPPSPGS